MGLVQQCSGQCTGEETSDGKGEDIYVTALAFTPVDSTCLHSIYTPVGLIFTLLDGNGEYI